MLYLDNVCVKGPKTDYREEEVEPRIRRYIAEHLLSIDTVLTDIKRAGAIVSSYKSDVYYLSIVVVGYRININSRHSN